MHNPRTIYRWAIRIAAAAAPLAVLLLLVWGLRLHDKIGARPHLVTMLFMLLLMVAAGAGMVAALASCHLAAHKAFTAGYTAGAATTARQVGLERAEEWERPGLRVVGDDRTT